MPGPAAHRPCLGALLVAAALAFALGACDRKTDGTGPRAAADPAAAAASIAAANDATRRYNEYVDIQGSLAAGNGLGSTRRSYERAVLDARRGARSVSFHKGSLGYLLGRLRTARALPGGGVGVGVGVGEGLAELDAAADGLIQSLPPLVARLDEVDVYYTSRAYLEDDFSKAKAKYASTLGLFNAAEEAADAFDAALEATAERRSRRELETLQRSGDALAYNGALAMSQAKSLLRAVQASSTAAPTDKAAKQKLAEAGDPIVASLEKTLADQRTEIGRLKAADAGEATRLRMSYPEQVVDALTGVIGAYRSFKLSRSGADAERLVERYNSAVESSNRGRNRMQVFDVKR